MVGEIQRDYQSLQTPTITVAGGANQQGSLTFTMPQGFQKVAGMFFDPSLNFLVTLESQQAKRRFLNSFGTKIGNYGWVPMYNRGIPNDVLTLTWLFLDAPAANFLATFTLGFE